MTFKLKSSYQPRGDQPAALPASAWRPKLGQAPGLTRRHWFRQDFRDAKVIEASNRPRWFLPTTKRWLRSSITSSNPFSLKTPSSYFVSYYDFYQPEAYVPAADVYIEKESTINDELDKLRMSATRSLFDAAMSSSWLPSVAFTASALQKLLRHVSHAGKGFSDFARSAAPPFCRHSIERSEDLRRGTFRVRGDILEIYPTYEDNAYRIEMWATKSISSTRSIH